MDEKTNAVPEGQAASASPAPEGAPGAAEKKSKKKNIILIAAAAAQATATRCSTAACFPFARTTNGAM